MMGFLVGVLGIGRSIGGFLAKLPWQVYAILGAIAALLFAWHVHTNQMRDYYNAAYTEGSRATAAKFTAAQAKADTEARAHVKVTVVKQDTISTEVSNARQDSVTAIDARAAQLSLRHDAAARRSASGPGNPDAPGKAASGTCPAPAQDGLPWAVALPAMTQAAKDLDQLNKVLDWEERQQALDATEPVDQGAP